MLRKLQATNSSMTSNMTASITTAPSPTITPIAPTQSSTNNIYPSNSVYESISPNPSLSATTYSTFTPIYYTPNGSPYPSGSPSPTSLNSSQSSSATPTSLSVPSTGFMDSNISIQGKYIIAIMVPIGIILIMLIICVNRLDDKNKKLEYDLYKKSIINQTNPVYPVGRSNVRSILSM